jgi:hypothetical protein
MKGISIDDGRENWDGDGKEDRESKRTFKESGGMSASNVVVTTLSWIKTQYYQAGNDVRKTTIDLTETHIRRLTL